MTITIYTPPSAGLFGPGWSFSVETDFVGPPETGTHWQLTITQDTVLEEPFRVQTFPFTDNFLTANFGLAGNVPVTLSPTVQESRHGAAARLLVELRTVSTVIESLSIPITWDLQSGIPLILQQEIRQQGPVNAETSEQLELIDQAVHMSFPSVGRIPIGDFLGGNLSGLAVRELITPDRTGEGTLDHPLLGVDVNAYGIEWEVISFPPGNGVVQGAPDRWSRRVLDLQLVGTDVGSNEYTRTYESFHVDHYRLMFQGFGLTRLHYWIEPGVTIRFYWLV